MATTEKRRADTAPVRDGSRPTSRAAACARASRVVPLTGDASDRRYFRVLLRGRRRRSCWRCTPSRSTSDDAAVRERRRAARAMPLPVPAILGHARRSRRSWRSRISATSRCRRTSARRRRRSTPRCIAQAVALIETLQRRGAELASPAYPPYGIAFDVEKLTGSWSSSPSTSSRRYRGVALTPDERAARCGSEWRAIVEELAPSRACSAIATTTAAT